MWAINNINAQIMAVDSDQYWIEFVEDKSKFKNNLQIKYIDVGEIGGFGRPLSYSRHHNFIQYTNWLWGQGLNTDVGIG